jgi:hypothetical protein
MKGHVNTLSKRDKNKHFSHELWGGKGSCPRKQTEETTSNYSKGYDKIKFTLKTKYS